VAEGLVASQGRLIWLKKKHKTGNSLGTQENFRIPKKLYNIFGLSAVFEVTALFCAPLPWLSKRQL
jgi:hypothetical protein